MSRSPVRRALFAGASLALLACAPGSGPEDERDDTSVATASAALVTPRVLRVSLYPWIPDAGKDRFAGLGTALTQRFQAAHPDIAVQISFGPAGDYNTDPNGALSRVYGTGPGAADVAEVDTILLGQLVANGWVQPVGVVDADVLPNALAAATVNGTVYGVPTYTCTNVIYADVPSFPNVTDATSLIGFLRGIDPTLPPLVSYYGDGWTLPLSYVDGWGDSHGTAQLASSYSTALDPTTMSQLGNLIGACKSNGSNPCMDGTYKTGKDAQAAFASGKANAYLGYTENLFYILDGHPGRPMPGILSAPMGTGSHPTMFVDAITFNQACTGQCLADAQAFATFMSSVPTRNLIAFSQDVGPTATPRYLIQANGRFYSSQPAASDPAYGAYYPIVQASVAYPNQGFVPVRQAMDTALRAALK